jgi:hypothetical protein
VTTSYTMRGRASRLGQLRSSLPFVSVAVFLLLAGSRGKGATWGEALQPAGGASSASSARRSSEAAGGRRPLPVGTRQPRSDVDPLGPEETARFSSAAFTLASPRFLRRGERVALPDRRDGCYGPGAQAISAPGGGRHRNAKNLQRTRGRAATAAHGTSGSPESRA